MAPATTGGAVPRRRRRSPSARAAPSCDSGCSSVIDRAADEVLALAHAEEFERRRGWRRRHGRRRLIHIATGDMSSTVRKRRVERFHFVVQRLFLAEVAQQGHEERVRFAVDGQFDARDGGLGRELLPVGAQTRDRPARAHRALDDPRGLEFAHMHFVGGTRRRRDQARPAAGPASLAGEGTGTCAAPPGSGPRCAAAGRRPRWPRWRRGRSRRAAYRRGWRQRRWAAIRSCPETVSKGF